MKFSQAVLVASEPITPDLVKIEKNLNALGFFTPAKRRGEKAQAHKKVVSFRRTIDDQTFEAQATIFAVPEYGLPTASDLDKYLAFQKIVERIRERSGTILNPVSFTSADINKILGLGDSGRHYELIHEWLERMVATVVKSKAAVYFAKRKTFESDMFHVFQRVVIQGQRLPDGTIADRHYVWLSDWQLENINSNHVIPVDMETYRRLRTQIAKVLVPLLQIGLYASRSQGKFEKRYSDLCQLLDIKHYRALSEINRQLTPSLKELLQCGYIEKWDIKPTADGRDYKLVAYHGAKFYRDRKILNVPEGGEEESFQQLVKHGVAERAAKQLLSSLPKDQPMQDQIEYALYQMYKSKAPIKNPAGFIVAALKSNTPVPEKFETSSRRKLRAAQEQQLCDDYSNDVTLHADYEAFRKREVEKLLESMDPDQRTDRLASLRKEWKHRYPMMTREQIETNIANALVAHVREEAAVPTFEQWQKLRQGQLF